MILLNKFYSEKGVLLTFQNCKNKFLIPYSNDLYYLVSSYQINKDYCIDEIEKFKVDADNKTEKNWVDEFYEVVEKQLENIEDSRYDIFLNEFTCRFSRKTEISPIELEISLRVSKTKLIADLYGKN